MLSVAPKVSYAEFFTAIPTHLRPEVPCAQWKSVQPDGTPVTTLIEGPSFDRYGNLYCVDLPNGRIFRVDSTGSFELVTEYDGWPNGLKVHQDGRLFVTDFKRGIVNVDPESGKVTQFLDRADVGAFKGVNDLFFAASGDLYFTDQGLTGLHDPTGRLFRVSNSGRVTCLLDRLPSPNGVVMDLEERCVYIAVTRANAVWKVPLDKDGNATKVGTFIQMSGGSGPDGLALNAQGGLAVAHVGMGSIWLFDEAGELMERIVVPGHRHTTNIAYGGLEGKTLFITESGSGSIYKTATSVAGKGMFSHQSSVTDH